MRRGELTQGPVSYLSEIQMFSRFARDALSLALGGGIGYLYRTLNPDPIRIEPPPKFLDLEGWENPPEVIQHEVIGMVKHKYYLCEYLDCGGWCENTVKYIREDPKKRMYHIEIGAWRPEEAQTITVDTKRVLVIRDD